VRRLSRFFRAGTRLGFINLIVRTLKVRLAKSGDLLSFRLKGLPHGVVCRAGSTDNVVFSQVFIDEQYGPISPTSAGGLIIDCGANVGYSSLFFLAKNPSAHLIAIEPDPDNFAILRVNLGPYMHRCTLVQAALWSRNTQLRISNTPYRGGGAWAKTVEEVHDGRGEIDAVELGEVLSASGFGRIAILKMDVEGAEAEVFRDGPPPWLSRVDQFAVELHPDSPLGDGRATFMTAISEEDAVIREVGELTIADFLRVC
jgi:FkbM family methyltransferase